MNTATPTKPKPAALARLLEDLADGEPSPPTHRVLPPAVRASLVVHDGAVRPAILLADGSVLVLGIAQVLVLTETFIAWDGLFRGKAGSTAPSAQSLAP